jgi:toxin ParE1/3/4
MAHRVATEARNDLTDIWHYVATESSKPEIADRLIDFISERFQFLSKHPYGGRARDEVLSGVRSFPVGQYVILYRVESPDVFILRVMHGRRDIDSALKQ